MKKTVIIILCLVLAASILNVKVVTRQGINSRVTEIRIPLYLKILDYMDRHYNYIRLVAEITNGAKDGDEKVLKILDWVHTNIRDTPPGFPIMDDHPMNIITRGYGETDQFEDIFTILCYYSGSKAFYVCIKNGRGKKFMLSFVRLRGGWSPMLAHSGLYIRKGDRPATLKDATDDPSLLAPFTASIRNFDEKAFLDFINSSNFEEFLKRTTAQSPFGRTAYGIKRFFCGSKS